MRMRDRSSWMRLHDLPGPRVAEAPCATGYSRPGRYAAATVLDRDRPSGATRGAILSILRRWRAAGWLPKQVIELMQDDRLLGGNRRDGTRDATLTETVQRTPTGAVLFDQAIIRKLSEDMFLPSGWPHAEPVTGLLGSGGRGQTMFVGNVPRQFVLRHFLRGGLFGKIVHDSYAWQGEDATRSFAEWRMLDKMAANGLRVPRPAAARYCRHGLFYTADIITVRIPGVRPLSERLAQKAWSAEFWYSIGRAISAFHDCGVYHADMNAYNIQIDADGKVWMLDFDRGRLMPPGAWQQKTLSRLHRSLEKIKALDPTLNYRRKDWELLLEGYFTASSSA